MTGSAPPARVTARRRPDRCDQHDHREHDVEEQEGRAADAPGLAHPSHLRLRQVTSCPRRCDGGNVLHTDLRFRLTWLLMRPSMADHAAQPQRADGLPEPQREVEVVRHGEHVGGGLPVEPGAHDRGETPGRRGLAGAREEQVHGLVARVLDLDGEEQRRLALVRPAPSCRPRRRSAPAARAAPRDSSSSSCSRSLGVDVGEVVDELGQRRGQGHADPAPAASPWTIGTRTVLPHSVQLPS